MENEIKKQAAELAEKNSHVRKATERLMDEWAGVSACDEAIHSTTSIIVENKGRAPEQYSKYYLFAGEKEIAYMYEDYDNIQYYDDTHFSIDMPMPALRGFLEKFSQMVDEISSKMKEKKEKNSEILETIEKFLK